ncbi:MAG: 2Fe-2S iron-sulfur cluster binding domain-containing protein [Candidatus Riflebacteria bacterium]|nr:2Fe-2S iron-sulfur cluster binding domain-containing protein [Candidatus Riflebacteria bacterium]
MNDYAALLIPLLIINAMVQLLSFMLGYLSKKFGYGKPVEVKLSDEKTLVGQSGETLLSLLARNNLLIKSSCGGKGTCGECRIACKSEEHNAVIAWNSIERSLIPENELKTAHRLACQQKLKQNISVSLPGNSAFFNKKTANLIKFEAISISYKKLFFRLPDSTDFKPEPGQYIQIFIEKDSDIFIRSYSIASFSNDGIFELNVRFVEDGVGSTYLFELKEGDEISFFGPMGDFRVPENHCGPLIFVAGGAGFAPIKYILLELYKRKFSDEVFFFWGVSSFADLYDSDLLFSLAESNKSFHVFFSVMNYSDSQPFKLFKGNVIQCLENFWIEKPEAVVPKLILLSGPQKMVEKTCEFFSRNGINPQSIIYDKW